MSEMLWSLRARSVAKARKAFLRSEPEGLHDLRVALRRVEATASALGLKKVERQSQSLVRSLSPMRQIEVDRNLLRRLGKLGQLSEGVVAGLDARWGAEYADGIEKANRIVRSGRRRRLEKQLRRLASRPDEDAPSRLEMERQRVERRLTPPPQDATDKRLHRYRIAVKQARYLAEDLAALGVSGLESRIAREKDLQDALGHWNDIQLLGERLKKMRKESQKTGSVGLALELDHVIAALDGTVVSARREALGAAGRFSKILPFVEKTA